MILLKLPRRLKLTRIKLLLLLSPALMLSLKERTGKPMIIKKEVISRKAVSTKVAILRKVASTKVVISRREDSTKEEILRREVSTKVETASTKVEMVSTRSPSTRNEERTIMNKSMLNVCELLKYFFPLLFSLSFHRFPLAIKNISDRFFSSIWISISTICFLLLLLFFHSLHLLADDPRKKEQTKRS